MYRILCLHGPNLNLLGVRNPDIYGTTTLAQINEELHNLAAAHGLTLECKQSNHEGELITWIQQARGNTDGLIFNPAGYTHSSVALRDAVLAAEVPLVEVHLSNVYAREPFRHKSHFADIAVARLMGFGGLTYTLALLGLKEYLDGTASAT